MMFMILIDFILLYKLTGYKKLLWSDHQTYIKNCRSVLPASSVYYRGSI